TRSVPLTLRVRNVGSSPLDPIVVVLPRRLNSAFISSVMSPDAATRGVMSRFTPTFRYWNEVAGENVLGPVAVAWNVVTGTGTSVPILSVAFFPSAARRRGEARIFVLASVCMNFAKRLLGRLTTKSARLIEDKRCARTFVKVPSELLVISPAAPVG